MRLWRAIRRLRGVWSGVDHRTVDLELQSHVEFLADEYRSHGMPEHEARARAEREFGNRTRIGEDTRAVATYAWLEGLAKDLAHATRQLRRSPVVSALAIASLTVGIGANVAIYSVVNALLLRTLPVPHADRLAAVSIGDDDVRRLDGSRWSFAFWRAFTAYNDRFDGLLAWSHTRMRVTVNGVEDTVDGAFVNGGFFETLSLPMALGRPLTPADDAAGAPAVAVVSHGFWQRHLGGRADALGRHVVLADTPLTVVGVTPAGFSGLEVGQGADLVLPLSAEPVLRGAQSFTRPPFDAMNMWLRVGVRLRASQSLEEGSALMRSLQTQLREAAMPPAFPQLRQTFLLEPFGLTSASTGMSRLRQQYGLPLTVLRVLVALLLFLACANVANLLLGQTMARRHELGVRLALGGTRWRVARQLLAESALLSSVGLVLGMFVGQWVAAVLVHQLSTLSAPVTLDISLDWWVFFVGALVCMATTVACGTASALCVNAFTPAQALVPAAHGGTGCRRTWMPHALLAVQLGLSMTLVVGAGLFVRTFVALSSVDLGFERDRVLVTTAGVALTGTAPGDRAALFLRLLEAVRAVPGVERAAASSLTPVSSSYAPIVATSTHGDAAAVTGEATSNFVTPDWFSTYGIPILLGRDVAVGDGPTSSPVMLVNQTFAKRFFAGRNPIGESVAIGIGRKGEVALKSRTIVGVVGDAVYRSLREPAQASVFLPFAQYDYPSPMPPSVALSVRPSAGPAGALASSTAAALHGVHERVVVTSRSLDAQVRESLQQEELLASLSMLFGFTALLLGAIGLFGVTHYAVSRRQRELAIRLAVGASGRALAKAVLSSLSAPLLIGIATGGLVSTWLSGFAGALLFGVTSTDAATLGTSTLLMLCAAVLAAWIPIRRALRISPVDTLRAS